jgi:GT2 family glycosyltransferase
MKKSVFLIILNYNHREELNVTLSSFNKQDYLNLKLIISDNASTDNSLKWVKENFPEVIILENEKNLGWSGGNNVGINYALNENADYIVLSNNDIFIEDTSLISKMVEDLEKLKEQKVYILGTKVNYFPDKDKTHNTGWKMYPKHEKKGFFFNKYRAQSHDKLDKQYEYVDSADGCFLMADAQVFKNTGLLNEGFFMYADEIEFSMRAWSKGYKSAVDKNLTIYHKVGTSSIPRSPFSIYYRYRNLYFLIKHNPEKRHFMAVYFRDVLKAIVLLFFSAMNLRMKWKTLQAILKGVKDGFLNNTGMRYSQISGR